MGDYHVDRPGVEGEQSLELTGTNSPETFKTLRKYLEIDRYMKVLLCAAFRVDRLELRLDVAAGSDFWRP